MLVSIDQKFELEFRNLCRLRTRTRAQVKTFVRVRRTLFARMVAWTLELDSQSLGRTKPYYLG